MATIAPTRIESGYSRFVAVMKVALPLGAAVVIALLFSWSQLYQMPERFEIDESYGGVAWSVRGIYHGYAGWFDGEPATLLSESPDVKIRELVELADGIDAVVARAEALEDEGDLVLSLNMADAALAVDPNHPGALAVRVSLLTELGRNEKNFNARSWIGYHRRLAARRLASQQ